jgi:hypothetical protein
MTDNNRDQASINKVEEQLNIVLVDEKLIDLNETLAESAGDLFFKGGILDGIPVVGGLLKTLKAGISIREYFFAKKLLTFLVGIHQADKENRRKFREKMDREETFRKVSEHLLVILDKIEDLEKATLIAKIFMCLLNDDINYTTFRYYSGIVAKAFIDDLKTLKGIKSGKNYTGYAKSSLLGLGLLDLSPTEMEKRIEDSDNHHSSHDGNAFYTPKKIEKTEFLRTEYRLVLDVEVNEDGELLSEILFGKE